MTLLERLEGEHFEHRARRCSFERAHPEVVIYFSAEAAGWVAVWRVTRAQITARSRLDGLLDILEALGWLEWHRYRVALEEKAAVAAWRKRRRRPPALLVGLSAPRLGRHVQERREHRHGEPGVRAEPAPAVIGMARIGRHIPRRVRSAVPVGPSDHRSKPPDAVLPRPSLIGQRQTGCPVATVGGRSPDQLAARLTAHS